MSRRDHGTPGLSVLLAAVLVVAAVLFPVFATRHPAGRLQSCLSNEKQLGLALLQYAQDSDGQLPGSTQGGGEGWGGQVFPYVRDVRAFQCGDDPTAGTASSPVLSYGYNSNAAENPAVGQYAASARTVLLFEVAHDSADVGIRDEGASLAAASYSSAGDGTEGTLLSGRGDARYATGLLGNRTPAEFSQFDGPRHDGGANFLLSDGHAEWLRPQNVSGGTNARRLAAPQQGVTKGAAAGTASRAYQATFSTK